MAQRASLPSPNKAPAFAAVAVSLRAGSAYGAALKFGTATLFCRDGGSPVWVPAFAGKRS